MNTSTSKILEETSISSRAMKFTLSRGGTAKRVRDKDAEALVKSTLGDEGQIVSRELFTDKSNLVYQYQQLGNEMYSYHVRSTLPFGDGGARLLPNNMYFTYTTQMQNYISRLDQIKTQILNSWDSLVQADVNVRNARLIGQGKAASAATTDYPTKAQMEYRLYVNWYPEPVSTSGDFRFELPPEMLQRVDAQIDALVQEAGRELYVRMLHPVTAFINKLNKFTGAKGERWHDSFVDNLNSLAKDLPQMNVNDDPGVTAMLAQIEAIIKPYAFQTEVLKESDVARADVKAKLQALEQQLKGYTL